VHLHVPQDVPLVGELLVAVAALQFGLSLVQVHVQIEHLVVLDLQAAHLAGGLLRLLAGVRLDVPLENLLAVCDQVTASV